MVIAIHMLEDDDIIEASDYTRQLSLFYEGQSDYLATVSTYGGFPINHLRWIEVSRSCPAWIGKTVREVRLIVNGMRKPHQRFPDHEFIRGNVPSEHILPETQYEEYSRLHKHYILRVGKYKGERAADIKRKDRDYYEWAVNVGIIPNKVAQSFSEFL